MWNLMVIVNNYNGVVKPRANNVIEFPIQACKFDSIVAIGEANDSV